MGESKSQVPMTVAHRSPTTGETFIFRYNADTVGDVYGKLIDLRNSDDVEFSFADSQAVSAMLKNKKVPWRLVSHE